MRIVVGLGNPGRSYAGSRHNVGFLVADELAQRWCWSLGDTRDGLQMGKGRIDDEMVVLVEPQMYMNCSGAALAHIEPPIRAQELIVIHDDLDLKPGCIRVKHGGGSAGHRGLESIVEQYGSDFTRVRVGIGRPARGMEVVDYVLSPFDPHERDTMLAAVQRAADAVECLLREGEVATMNVFNVRTSRPASAADMGRE